jgi:type VI secretion system secreted protein Hcp
MKKILVLLGVVSCLAAGIAWAAPINTVNAAAYLKFDGIEGEARDKDHVGWIELLSVSQPMHDPSTTGSAARRRGDVILEDITVSKTADKASPKLAEAVCKGEVIPKVEIHVTATDGGTSSSSYYTYELTNVRVTSYSVSATGSAATDRPMEEISLNFEEVKVNYTNAGSKGKSKGKVETSWKVEEGEK